MTIVKRQSVWVGPACGGEMIFVFEEAEVVLFDITIEEHINEVSDPSSLVFGSWGNGNVDSLTFVNLFKFLTLPDDGLNAELS